CGSSLRTRRAHDTIVAFRYLEITMKLRTLILALTFFLATAPLRADLPKNPAQFVKDHYTKQTYQIPMRDGVRLTTIVYSPKDASQQFPMMMMRTPYGIGPYEEDKMRGSLGPSGHFLTEGYIFVYQDVRGCYMSE